MRLDMLAVDADTRALVVPVVTTGLHCGVSGGGGR